MKGADHQIASMPPKPFQFNSPQPTRPTHLDAIHAAGRQVGVHVLVQRRRVLGQPHAAATRTQAPEHERGGAAATTQHSQYG